ncbi:MAG: NapC/NirT family cytochrome c [Deltaproteobacteria bacterium]|nr:NapC/NirT family cytochrome c [Deltaproteobacteria bacterium]
MSITTDPFLILALVTASLSVVVIAWFLVWRPELTRGTKVALLFGIGLLPIATAANGNIAGYHATKQTSFCSSCHVMTPYGNDSRDLHSTSLASRHARNEAFGEENCYTCHADYGMFGTITTKLGGLRHVYEYALNYRTMPIDDFLATIEIRKPFPNSTCIRCHSTYAPGWTKIGDHASAIETLRDGRVSCASEGCHGPAHPFSKAARRQRAAGAGP